MEHCVQNGHSRAKLEWYTCWTRSIGNFYVIICCIRKLHSVHWRLNMYIRCSHSWRAIFVTFMSTRPHSKFTSIRPNKGPLLSNVTYTACKVNSCHLNKMDSVHTVQETNYDHIISSEHFKRYIDLGLKIGTMGPINLRILHEVRYHLTLCSVCKLDSVH